MTIYIYTTMQNDNFGNLQPDVFSKILLHRIHLRLSFVDPPDCQHDGAHFGE